MAPKAIWQATQDENTIMFNKKQQPDSEAIKSAVEEQIYAPAQAATASSSPDDLERLAALRDKGGGG